MRRYSSWSLTTIQKRGIGGNEFLRFMINLDLSVWLSMVIALVMTYALPHRRTALPPPRTQPDLNHPGTPPLLPAPIALIMAYANTPPGYRPAHPPVTPGASVAPTGGVRACVAPLLTAHLARVLCMQGT